LSTAQSGIVEAKSQSIGALSAAASKLDSGSTSAALAAAAAVALPRSPRSSPPRANWPAAAASSLGAAAAAASWSRTAAPSGRPNRVPNATISQGLTDMSAT
jgi:hypothetical protein